MVMVLLRTLLLFKEWGLAHGLSDGKTYGRTDSRMSQIFEIDGLPRYGLPLARRSSAIKGNPELSSLDSSSSYSQTK